MIEHVLEPVLVAAAGVIVGIGIDSAWGKDGASVTLCPLYDDDVCYQAGY